MWKQLATCYNEQELHQMEDEIKDLTKKRDQLQEINTANAHACQVFEEHKNEIHAEATMG